MYNESYNGNVVFYDPDVTDEARRTILDIENDALTYSYDVATEDKYFDDVPDRYKKLIPEVRYEDIRQDIVDEIGDARTKFLNSIKSIENAITDYCDGDGVISEENKATLDFYLGQNNPSPNPNSSPKGGTGGGNGSNSESDSDEDENLEVESSEISQNSNEGYDAQITNEEIVMGQVDGITGSTSEAVIPLLDGDGTREIDSSDVASSGMGTSLYSVSSNFDNSAVLPTASVNENNDKDNNEIFAASSASAAAMVALSGKIMYDKKHEDSDTEVADESDCNLSIQEEHVSDGMILGTNSVDFKNDLLDQMMER